MNAMKYAFGPQGKAQKTQQNGVETFRFKIIYRNLLKFYCSIGIEYILHCAHCAYFTVRINEWQKWQMSFWKLLCQIQKRPSEAECQRKFKLLLFCFVRGVRAHNLKKRILSKRKRRKESTTTTIKRATRKKYHEINTQNLTKNTLFFVF